MSDTFDGITIGTTMTESYLENGDIRSEAIGKSYDLRYRPDLTGTQANYNIGTSDNSKVFEAVKTYGQNTNELISNAKDIITDSISTIEEEHNQIHKGNHFFFTDYVAVTANATLNCVLKTGSKSAHFVYGITGNEAGIQVTTYENVTSNEDGTQRIPLNNNRASATASTAVIRLNPTGVVITSATTLRNGINGISGGVGNRVSGNMERGNEVILKPNTKYMIKIVNLSSATNNINLNLDWYEL